MPPRRKPAVSAVIPVRFPLKDGDHISRAAAKTDTTLSGFVRLAAVEKAHQVLGTEPLGATPVTADVAA